MPLLKRKPVLMHPLPSLSAIVQPLHAQAGPGGTSTSVSDSSPRASTSALDGADMPQDGKDDDEQLEKLVSALNDSTLNAPHLKRGHKVNGTANGSHSSMPPPSGPPLPYRVKNIEVFYMPETGEVFLDYETFATRRAFYDQQVFQCEVSGKSALSYFDALDNEAREVRQLHSRFPKQLRKAVLQAVNFQVEGKLETLADRIFERFVNRFFDNEKVFVDVQGDKYLARVVRTFPPKNLQPPSDGNIFHPYATDLSMSNEDVIKADDPMKYFYQVRLIEEGGDGEGGDDSGDEVKGDEKWEGSVMEVQADKISRDRINFSRAMLKRFIRDCVHRDAAIFSPWIVKKNVGKRYGLPTELNDETRSSIAQIKKREMEKRKRERDERLGITHTEVEDTAVESEPPAAKRKKKASNVDREAVALEKQKEKQREKEEREREKERIKKEKEEEEERKKKRAVKYPAEDLLVEYTPERDGPAGRIEVRPVPNKQLPFGDQFEKFLMAWSFLNVMGKPLGLSPFTIDDFEQALYHTDPYTSPCQLLVEVHAALLNILVRDAAAGGEPVQPLAHTGQQVENDTDYWEGNKGATTETLRAAAQDLADKWRDKELSARDNRRGWESALVGCLWDRATLDVLPKYLDNILHLTFEDKPAPTRPTWSTGPSSNTGAYGLIPSKPEKRYTSLHFVHKLNIIAFLIELVAQTVEVRDYMEEASALLTEVRKEQIEARREQRRIHAELDALEPKEEKKENDGDASMEGKNDESRIGTPNGHANGTAAPTEQDELDESMMGDDRSRMSSPASDADGGRAHAGALRRRAMKERAAEREAEEAMRAAKAAKERQELRAKKVEMKQLAAEKKKLQDEEAVVDGQLKQLELDFRRYFYALRARPIGTDRFGNRVWWMDGLGSAPLYRDGSNKIQWGTGRLYIQGGDELELELSRTTAAEIFTELTPEGLAARREKEEGGCILAPGEWAVYDTPEQLEQFLHWLNPRGVRELHLLRALKQWWPEISGGCKARRLALGLDAPPEEETTRRTRPTRRAAGGVDEEGPSFLSWKNRRTPGKE